MSNGLLDGQAIESFLKVLDTRPPRKVGYSVTELTSCLRRTFYNRVYQKSTQNNGPLLIGKILHEKIIPKVVPQGTVLEKSFEFYVEKDGKEIQLTGHADGVYKDTIYEFKFVSSLDIPASYFEQVNAYSILDDAKRWQIIAVNKATLEVRTWEGEPDQDLYAQTIDKLLVLDSAIEKKEPPEGPSFGMECMYCEYRKNCYAGGHLDSPKSQEELNADVQKKEES